MPNHKLVCLGEERRQRVRSSPLNGLDYLEVSDDQRLLTVYFLDKAPVHLQKENVLIKGGQRVTGLKVIDIKICRIEDEERDDYMMVWVDKPGDFSPYTLAVVEIDEHGQPIVESEAHGCQKYRPMSGFDQCFACLEFSFKAGCPSDLDCKPQQVCPPLQLEEPQINYLAKDYASFRQLILDRLALIMPDWRERHVPDLGITLVELLAYLGDHLSYFQDAVATEAYLDTARQRISVRRHARLVDYFLHEGCNARAWITLWVSQDIRLNPSDFYLITDPGEAVAGHVHHHHELPQTWPKPYLVFEPLVEDGQAKPEDKINLYQSHNEILIYTWGDKRCYIPKGATSATLIDPGQATHPESDLPGPSGTSGTSGTTENVPGHHTSNQPAENPVEASQNLGHRLKLQPGDLIIFEEVRGPKTGNPADADPSHRHVVRLTKVTPSMDMLNCLTSNTAGGTSGPVEGTLTQPKLIMEIEWLEEDALPFPVCVSSIKEEDGSLIQNVSVVRGNIILVDHGQWVEDNLGQVPSKTLLPDYGHASVPGSLDECAAREALKVAGWYRPALSRTEVTFSQPLGAYAPGSKSCPSQLTPATAMLKQDVRQTLPQIKLEATLADQTGSATSKQETWEPQQDLLSSGPDDRFFVAEIDNDRRCYLRFGDGELGHRPLAGMFFQASYRIGNGAFGNVGAETISHLVFRHNLPSGLEIRSRNPLPAAGGTEPEQMAEAKLFAPHAFRKDLQRAIIAEDYAQIVRRDFKSKVQRAAARMQWTGSWYEVLVAIDPLGSEEADQELLSAISSHLWRYRRIGHEVVVKGATYVPLDIAMTVCVLSHYLRGHVKAALLNVFSHRRLPDGQLGFFHPDNLSFGQGIYLSNLVAAAQAVVGVEAVTVTKLERFGQGPNQEIANGILPLGPFEVARLDNDPNFPENGKLTIYSARA